MCVIRREKCTTAPKDSGHVRTHGTQRSILHMLSPLRFSAIGFFATSTSNYRRSVIVLSSFGTCRDRYLYLPRYHSVIPTRYIIGGLNLFFWYIFCDRFLLCATCYFIIMETFVVGELSNSPYKVF